ncbi:hypothetical protein FCOIX_7883 [Fusarium coicis]|nr:hypothetical protein FCOIX_7883 [Fusarium coicis]
MVRLKSSALKQYAVNFADHADIRGGGDPIRFEMFHIPGASEADCAQHYRDEFKARGDVSEQVQQAGKAYEDWEDKEKDAQYAAEEEPHGNLLALFNHKGA